jgi:tryptophan halogenase
MKKVVIVGGGTAGWLTALFVNKFWKGTDVTLIESSKIGILGAGEGVTPNFGSSLKLLGIRESDFLTQTKSTIKTGLQFVNWRGDGKTTLHPFMGSSSYEVGVNNGYHMDARLVASYFKQIATSRGVIHIDGEISGFNRFGEDIRDVILKDGTTIQTDFIFDCSGFARLLIGKEYGVKWNTYTEDLIVNSAFAYFLPQQSNLTNNSRTQTNLISMKSGWMWQAPLQHRWGCGYVFNDTYITLEEAKIEVEKYIGKEIQIVKTFKYDSGVYEKCWVGNCIALGLSSGFLEPMESTALMTTIMQLKRLVDTNFDILYRDRFNDYIGCINEQNMLFVRYHYMCNREDTKFWKDYKKRSIPKKLSNLLTADGNISVQTNMELMEILETKESSVNELTFFVSNYNTVFKKNSNTFEKSLI